MAKLPPFVPYPSATWAQHLTPQDWDALVEAWLALIQTYLSLSDADLKQIISQDESVAVFLSSFVEQQASSEATSHSSPTLLRAVFQLTSQLLQVSPPPQLLTFPFLADLAKVFPKKHVSPVLSRLFTHHAAAAEAPLTTLKKLLIPALDAGIKTDLRPVEAQLVRLSPLLHASPHACTLFLAGSDFFDGLVACFRIMNPPLRKAIVTTLYLCIVGLTEADPPHWSMLSDQLYTLKDAADAHKQGPLNVNDSLVADLVTTTPLLKNLLRRAEVSGAAGDSLKKRITALEAFKKGPMVRPRRLVRRKVDKGKGKATRDDVQGEMHAHRMSQVTQVQDLFPDLGAGFVAKCLDEYGDDVEQVVANLLGETLPPSLASADRTEPLYVSMLFLLTILLIFIGLPMAANPLIWHLIPPHPRFQQDATYSTTTNSTVWQPTRPKSHSEKGPPRRLTIFSRIDTTRPTRRLSCLPSQRLTATMMSVTIRMTPQMWAA